MCWPNYNLPAGMANVDIEGAMPSSAYRKLLESLHCLQSRPPSYPAGAPPPPDDSPTWVVDLGACPGGWTGALRKMGCAVIGVDRSPLAPDLMSDVMVKFVKGDAFSYSPPWGVDNSTPPPAIAPKDSWLVSDVIAYPDRVVELLDRWCGSRWAQNMVVTMKFQGATPSWDELDYAIGVASRHGYDCRAKHFFNNKNEVTLMASQRKTTSESGKDNDESVVLLGGPMYPSAFLR